MTTATAARSPGYVPLNPPDYARAPEGEAWVGPDLAAASKADRAALYACFALVPGTIRDLEVDCKYGHHRADGSLVWKGVAGAMAALLAEHASLEPALARAAYEHLADHFTEFGKTAPAPPSGIKAAPDDKSFLAVPFSVKAVDRKARRFRGLAATWDLDLGMDRIHRGAFRETLAEWKRAGKALPLLDSHNPFSIFNALGKMTDGRETKAGLETEWELVLGPDGDRVADRLESGVIDSLSIGYKATQFDFEEDEDSEGIGLIRNLRQIKLRETSLVVFPMNPHAAVDLASVKAVTAARALAAGERAVLESFHAELGRLLSAPADPPPGPSKSEVDADDSFSRLARLRVQRLRRTIHRS